MPCRSARCWTACPPARKITPPPGVSPLFPTTLYLDTARLGRMTPRAQRAHLDFTRLAGEEGGSLFFERFLRCGVEAWPESSRAAYAGLSDWRGVAALKSSLRVLAGSDPELPVLLAARS